MKFVFNPSPNYHSGSSTKRIMNELSCGLLAVFAFSVVNQAVQHGIGNVIHLCVMMACGVATAILTELAWAKWVLKTEPVAYVKTSFGWITAIILVMMMPINMSIYPVIVGTVFAIVIGKLVFGGFGSNIFNPAAAGCAVIFSYFSTSRVADIVTSATPTSLISGSYGWVVSDPSVANQFLSQFGGLGGLAVGFYDGSIGETCALLLLVVGVVLSVVDCIDWRIPTFYLGAIFVFAWIYGSVLGMGMWYPVFHLLTGGAVFGAVFMLTDPVTNPTTFAGKVVFSIGAALLTVLIRVRGSLPEGVLYSILLMNMLVPWIERVCSGIQYKDIKKYTLITVVTFLAGCALMFGVGIAKKNQLAETAVTANNNIAVVETMTVTE